MTGKLNTSTNIAAAIGLQEGLGIYEQNYFHRSKAFYAAMSELSYRNKNISDNNYNPTIAVDGASITPVYRKPYKLLFLGDSIFERIRVPFLEYLINNYQVNGLGFSPLEATDRLLFTGKNEAIATVGITTTSNDAASDENWGIAGRKHTGATGATISYTTYAPFKFTDCKIFYLKKTGNGTFRYKVDTGDWVTVDTNLDLGLGYVSLTELAPATHTVYMEVLSGSVSFYGIYTSMENNMGVVASYINKGSTTSTQWAARMTFPKLFADIIGVDQYNICIGANDVTAGTLHSQFETNLTAIITALSPTLLQDVVLYGYPQKGSSSGLDVYGNPIYNLANTEYAEAFKQYTNVLKKFSVFGTCSFFDMAEIIPDRTKAWAIGLYADSIHLSDVGGMFVGMFMADCLLPKSISSKYTNKQRKEIKFNAPCTHAIEVIATGVQSGDNRFSAGVLTDDGDILLIPNVISYPQRWDVNTHLKVNTTAAITMAGFSAGVRAKNGLTYFIPYSGNYIGVYDSETDTLGKITLPAAYIGMQYKWNGGVLAPNGKIYCMPWKANVILTIDTLNNNALSDAITITMSDFKYSCGVLAPNGKIYSGGVVDSKILVLDTLDDTYITISYTNALSSQFGTGTVGHNGMVYLSALNGLGIMKINPADNSYSIILTDACGETGAMVGAADGLIYIVDNTDKTIKILDPDTDTITKEIDISAHGTAWKGGILAPNGKIYFLPRYGTKIVVISTGLAKFDSKYYESPYLNKY